jgi:hypothetical protein
MSTSEGQGHAKHFKRLCAACRERKVRFRYRGDARADRDHTLCFECCRAEINRARARRLIEGTATSRTRPLFADYEAAVRQSLSQRQVAHRQLMLAQLQATTDGRCHGR